jgi:cytoskeletal protein RodZ
METKDTTQDRVRARDAAMRLLNRLTTGAALSALIGVGLFGAVSAYTIPGTTTSSTASASTSATSSSSTSSTSTSSGLQSSTTPVTSSSSSGVAVSGGS